MYSPRSLRTSRKARKVTKIVKNPRDSVRALYVEGNFGKASKSARGVWVMLSSLSSRDGDSDRVVLAIPSVLQRRQRERERVEDNYCVRAFEPASTTDARIQESWASQAPDVSERCMGHVNDHMSIVRVTCRLDSS